MNRNCCARGQDRTAPHPEMVGAASEMLSKGTNRDCDGYGLMRAQNGGNVNLQCRGYGNLGVLRTRT